MNIYVTGGSGFLGQKIIQKVSEIDLVSSVINLDLFNSGSSEFQKTDITKIESLRKVNFKSNDIVIHAAARIFNDLPKRKLRKKFFDDVNYYGTLNLLDSMLYSGAKKIIFISTDMTYGMPISTPVDEKHPQKPIGEYGLSKLSAEKLIISKTKNQDIKSVIFRPRVIMGSGRLGLFSKLFRNIKYNLPIPIFGEGKNRYQFISVDDFAEAIKKALEQNIWNEIFNIGSNNSPTVAELLTHIIKVNKSKSKLIKLNGSILKSTLNILDKINISPLYPEQYLIADCDYVLDTSKLKRILKWEPNKSDYEILQDAYESFLEL